MQTYTFMCLNRIGVASAIDIASLADDDYHEHANNLLRQHLSACAIEVWSDTSLIALIERPRSFSGGACC